MIFNKSQTKSGIPVVSLEMPGFKTVGINLIVGVGSRYENDDEQGISHFLEHMAFKGTKNRTALQIAEEFDSIGGHFNAYTSKETTVYYAKVLKENISKALDIISDIIQNSLYEEEEIKKEYDVICQEIAQLNDSPDEYCFENLIKAVYKDQPLGRSILGTSETIKDFGRSNFVNFIGKNYSAQNMVLSFAGDINHDEVFKIAEEKLSSIKTGTKGISSKAIYSPDYLNINRDLEQANLYISFESISFENLISFYHTQMLSLIFGGGLSSRLFQTIREKYGLAYSVGSFNMSFSDTGLFTIYAGTSPEKAPFALEKISDEILRLKNDKISEDELNRAKQQIKSNILMQEEKTASKSEEIGKNYLMFKKYISSNEVIEEIEKTSLDDLSLITNKIFSSIPSIGIISKNTEINYDKFVQSLK